MPTPDESRLRTLRRGPGPGGRAVERPSRNDSPGLLARLDVDPVAG